MIKTLARQIKEYKRASLVTPIFMILEVAIHIFVICCYMCLAAIVVLFAGGICCKYGAKAST